MRIKSFFSIAVLLSVGLALQNVYGFVTATVNGDGVTLFPGNVSGGSIAIHKKTGIVVAGARNASDNGPIVWRVGPTIGDDIEAMTAVATSANNGNTVVAHTLALSENQKWVDNFIANPGTDPLSQIRALYVSSADFTQLNCINLDGSLPTTIIPQDHAGDVNNGIVAATASSTHVFMALKQNGSNFFDAGSVNACIRFATINPFDNTLSSDGTNHIVIQVNSDYINGQSGDNVLPVSNVATLAWSSNLSRLYIGLQGAAQDGGGANTAFLALVIMDTSAIPNITPLLNHSTQSEFLDGLTTATSNIVGITPGATAFPTSLAIVKLDVMYTTTQHNYVIVNGGIGTAITASNKIFAIPLVDSDGDYPGSLAHVTNLDTGTTNFKKNATVKTALLREDKMPAIVGAGPLPVTAVDGVVTQMTVVGDTVYCSTNAAAGNDDQAGLYYSQALFNIDGSINRWTNWAKAVPNQVSGEDATEGACFGFAVDALTGKIWTIPNFDKAQLRVTRWERDSANESTTFCGPVNLILNGPCYSQLNLHKQTYNYGVTNCNTYALFGGDSKVVVVRTGKSAVAGYSAIEVPTSDWTDATVTATDISRGLEGVGPITALAWTNRDDVNTWNYFFAGTNQGLYVFAREDGVGIQIGHDFPGDVDAPPFSNYRWQKFDAFGNDPVAKIISGAIYTNVITQGKNHTHTTLPFGDTLDNLNTAFLPNQGLTLPLVGSQTAEPTYMYDTCVINTADADNVIGVITTDKAIFPNNVVGRGNLFHIGATYTPQRTLLNRSFYYANRMMRLDENGKFALRSGLGMATFSEDSKTFTHFLKGDGIGSDTSVLPLAYPIKQFYTDGARRFYIESIPGNGNGSCTLHTVPYYNGINNYDVTKVQDIDDKAIAASKTFYWINEMGAGYLLAGTDNGVIALR